MMKMGMKVIWYQEDEDNNFNDNDEEKISLERQQE